MSREKTMRSLVWTNAFLGLGFVVLSLTSYIFSGTKLIPESPPAITQQITEIQDIERLRKVALLLVHNSDEMVRKTNQAFVSGIQGFGWLCFMCAIFFVANTLTMLHAARLSGKPGPSEKLANKTP